MTDWDKTQCGAEQGSDWDDEFPPDGGGGPGGPDTGWELPPEPCGQQEIFYATSTPYGINFEDKDLKAQPSEIPYMGIITEVYADVEEDGAIFGASFTFMEWRGLNGYGDDAILHETVIQSARVFGEVGYGDDVILHDTEVTSGQVYGLLYDKANETVFHETVITGASITAG